MLGRPSGNHVFSAGAAPGVRACQNRGACQNKSKVLSANSTSHMGVGVLTRGVTPVLRGTGLCHFLGYLFHQKFRIYGYPF